MLSNTRARLSRAFGGSSAAESEEARTANMEGDLSAFSIPDDTLGLHILHQPKDPEKRVSMDIIAVHGLGGDSFSTWTHKSSKKLWLRDILPYSPGYDDARIMTFGYDARAFVAPLADVTIGRAFIFGEALVGALKDVRVEAEAQDRPIIFVGHSLGGIVIKHALVYAQSRRQLFGDICASTRGIYFFGTPHQGASIAEWGVYLNHISKCLGIQASAVTKDLQRWSKPLLELTTLFSEQIPELLVVTYFEKNPLHGVIVVDEGSARLGQRNEAPCGLDGDHLSICKFESAKVAICRTVLASFEATALRIKMKAREQNMTHAQRSIPTTAHVGRDRQQTQSTELSSSRGGRDLGSLKRQLPTDHLEEDEGEATTDQDHLLEQRLCALRLPNTDP